MRTIRAGSDVDCYRGGCVHSEDIIIPIPFETLEAAAALFDPANPAYVLRYRLFGQSGERVDEGIPGNEIAAFVAKVRELQRAAE